LLRCTCLMALSCLAQISNQLLSPQPETVLFTICSPQMNAMITATFTQLRTTCGQWRNAIREYRGELTRFKQHLLKIAPRATGREDLIGVEHFDNQFHIQLINLHDLKQKIKLHEQHLSIARKTDDERLPYARVAEHENLAKEFGGLEQMLCELKTRFSGFTTRLTVVV
jgi:hypothetical protein